MAFKDKKTVISYNNQYNTQAYDRISLMVKKGYKEVIQSHAKKMGESTNAFINRSIMETIARDDTIGIEKMP